jgi:hypothetical protein
MVAAVACVGSVVACGGAQTTANHGAATSVTPTPAASASATPRKERHRARSKQAATKSVTAGVPAAPTLAACDANIIVRAATTSCGFAENVFYAYYRDATRSDAQNAIRAYSPVSHVDYAVACATDDAGDVTCVAGDGGEVHFRLAAIRAYDAGQAVAYAASHDLGPNADAHSGAAPSTTADLAPNPTPSPGSTGGDPPIEDRIPNYDNGTGYPVRCADGMWSQSGGRPGACSHHGGVG